MKSENANTKIPDEHLRWLTLQELRNPDYEGIFHLMKDRWWTYSEEKGGVAVFVGRDRKAFSPQCNSKQTIAERFLEIYESPYTLMFIERALIPWEE